MPVTGLVGEAQTRFSQLLKAGVAWRTALALADRVTDDDIAGLGGGGGGVAGVSSVNTRTGAVTLTKADVGLPNVDNTSDALKPVSNATSAAISAAIANLVNSAPGTMDTLGEIAALLSSDESTASALATTVAGKMAKAANGSDIVDIAAFRTALGLGSAALSAAGAFDASGAASAAQAAAIAASMQRSANGSDIAAPATFRTNLGLGAIATQNYAEGLLSAQPTAATFGVGWYFATDQLGGTLYHSDGATWKQYAPGVSAVGLGQRITKAAITANATTTSTAAVDVAGLSVTFTAVAGATYEVKFVGFVGNQTVNVQGISSITDAANTVIRFGGPTPRVAGDVFYQALQADVTPGAGSVTYKVRLASGAGGTALLLGAAQYPAELLVTRVG